MKNTALLIDTNVVLDWMMDREPFAQDSTKVLEICFDGKAKGYLVGHTILNAFYISRGCLNVDERKKILLHLCGNFIIIGIDKQTIIEALQNPSWKDLEDGLQMHCATTANVDYIITRDTKDFATSPIQALTPEEFLKMHR